MTAAFAELIEAIAQRAAELALEKLSEQAPAASASAARPHAVARRRYELEREAEALLARRPGLTTSEIARALRVRDKTIRETLSKSAGFSSHSELPGRSPKAKGWFLLSDSSPTDPAYRTSTQRPESDGAEA